MDSEDTVNGGALEATTIHCMSTELPSYEEAAALVAEEAARWSQLQRAAERVDAGRAQGRVLTRPLLADRDQPPFARSTRDGFACRAKEASAHLSLLVAGSTRAGEIPREPLPAGAAWEIMTGAPVPEGADAVMMLEHVETAAGKVRLLPPRTLKAGENFVAQGAQARQGDQLLPTGTVIRPGQVALAAACGQAGLEVFTRPRVAILPTGDELVPVKCMPAPGRFATPTGPCWPRWWLRRAARPGCCPRPPIVPSAGCGDCRGRRGGFDAHHRRSFGGEV